MCNQEYVTEDVARRQFNRDFDAATANNINQATEQAIGEAAAATGELISEAIENDELSSELTQEIQDELSSEYERAVESAKDGLKGKSAVLYCADNDENNIPDIWRITLDKIEVTASPILDLDNPNLQDALADAYAEAFSVAFQNALENLPPVEISFDSYWSSESQDMMNLNKLTPEQQDKFNKQFLNLCQNCFYSSLINKLDPELSITIDPNYDSQGGYSYNDNELIFPEIGNASGTTLGAELFHSYQAQCIPEFMEASLADPNNTGRSNIEFEEKFNTEVAGIFADGVTVTDGGEPDIEGGIPGLGILSSDVGGIPQDLYYWLLDLFDGSGGVFPSEFTPEQQTFYTSALESFQSYWSGSQPTGYGAPIDYDNLFPACVAQVIADSDC